MILLCIAFHVYHGPVDPSTRVTVLSESCAEVKAEKAARAVQACAKVGAERCEAFVYPGKVTIERKVVAR